MRRGKPDPFHPYTVGRMVYVVGRLGTVTAHLPADRYGNLYVEVTFADDTTTVEMIGGGTLAVRA